MYCKNCGKEIDDDASFCVYCGTPTGKRAGEDPAVRIPEETASGKGTRSLLRIDLLLVAAVIILIPVLLILFMRRSAGSGQNKNYEIPDDALSYNGHHYYIYSDMPTFDEAAEMCKELGGYLAVVDDADENEAIFNYMVKMGYDEAFFGLIFDQEKEEWVYVTGEKPEFLDWGVNSAGVAEPNNSGGVEFQTEFDVHMHDGHWNDAAFGAQVLTPNGAKYKDQYTYICEWDR